MHKPRHASSLTLAAVTLLAPVAGAQCLSTLFASNGGTATGGAVYFDLHAAGPIVLDALEANFLAPAGTPVGLRVFVRAGTSSGFEGSSGGWLLASEDDGGAVASGRDAPTVIALDPPVHLGAGTTGIALVALGSGHARTNGNGANQTYTDGHVGLRLGTSSNVPFGGAVFSPRVWNGTVCYRREVGQRYCSPAAASSTGTPGTIVATGSTVVADGDLRLTVLDAPPGVLVLGLASPTTGLASMPGGSQGTLCLGSGGSIGRFSGQAAPSSPAGAARIEVDLAAMPTPTGAVAVMPGDTWSFQAWFRDSNPGPTSNFTDAVTLQF